MIVKNEITGEIINSKDLATRHNVHETSILNAIRRSGRYRKDWIMERKLIDENVGIATKVMCIETGEIFNSYKEVERTLGAKQSNITTHIKYGFPKSVKGLHFKNV